MQAEHARRLSTSSGALLGLFNAPHAELEIKMGLLRSGAGAKVLAVPIYPHVLLGKSRSVVVAPSCFHGGIPVPKSVRVTSCFSRWSSTGRAFQSSRLFISDDSTSASPGTAGVHSCMGEMRSCLHQVHGIVSCLHQVLALLFVVMPRVLSSCSTRPRLVMMMTCQSDRRDDVC